MTATATADKAETTVVGRVARVTGPVVDIEFPHDAIPDIYNALKTTITIDGESTEITLEVRPDDGAPVAPWMVKK